MSRVCLRPFCSSPASELAEIKPEVSPHPIYSDSSPAPTTDHPTFNTPHLLGLITGPSHRPPDVQYTAHVAPWCRRRERRAARRPPPSLPSTASTWQTGRGRRRGCAGVRVMSCRVVRSAGTTGRSRPAPLSPPLGRGAATGCLPLHAQAPPPPPLFVALFPPSVAPPSAHSDSPPPLLPARNLGPFDSSLHFYFRCIAFQPTSSYS